MKIKVETVVLVLVIAALGAYLVLRNTDRTHYSLPQPDAVSAAQVTRIEIHRPDGTVHLERAEGDLWRIQPAGHKADKNKVDDMLKPIADLELTAMVSESEAYNRYDLGKDRKITVKAWAGDKLVREFSVGKVAPSYKHTFIALAGDPRVYHAVGSFRHAFDQTAEDLRDKNVLSFEPKDIRKITVRLRDTSTVLVREEKVAAADAGAAADETPSPDTGSPAQTRPVWRSTEGKSLDAAAVNRLLTTLSDLQCSEYLIDRNPSDFGTPLITIRLEGTRSHELTVFPRESSEEGPYPAVSSTVEDPFHLGTFSVENLLELFQEKSEGDPQ